MGAFKSKPGSISGAVLHSLFSRPATIGYLGGKYALDSRCRGVIRYDHTNCVACGLCMKDCPTGALRVVNMGTKEQKDMHAWLDTGKCIFCGQCADSCAKKCIVCTSESDLSRFSHEGLTVEL